MITRTAHAKINWSLAVTGRRPDGYHLLDMLMQSISLGDELTFSESDALSLIIKGSDSLHADESNLVLRAARLLQQETGTRRGAAIYLDKRIPMGAGLGGGSADAAATLLALNTLWNTGLSRERLLALALQLGADVPFCLAGGLSRVQGIGEILLPLSTPAVFPLVVVQPAAGLSTPAVFARYDASPAPAAVPPLDEAQDALLRGDAHALAQSIGNALQGPATSLRPEIAHAILTLEKLGALKAQMTGSGSAVIGLFASDAAARQAAEHCAQVWPACWYANTLPGT